ncbi:hypothetical protein [Amycolatopsis sp. NPDC003676]
MLLALDYPGYRAQARIDDLGLPEVTNLLIAPLPTATDCPGYVTDLLSRKPPGRVDAVLAYCASAPLAVRLVAELSIQPPLVLFDAEPVTAVTVLDAYRDAVRQLGVDATEDEIAELCRAVDAPTRFVAAVRADLQRRVSHTLIADGCDPATVDDLSSQLTEACLEWLTHLVAASGAGQPDRVARTLRVTSREVAGGDITVECGRDELLRHPDTRAAVMAFLAGKR